MTLVHEELSRMVIGAAVEVHRALGPGLLESTYEECLASELTLQHLAFVRQMPVPVLYKGNRLACGYRVDLLVEQAVLVEIKTVERLLPVHQAQVLTYLKLLELRKGLLINFHSALLMNGLKSLVL